MSELEEKDIERILKLMEEYAKDLNIDYKITSKRSSLGAPTILKYPRNQ
jgi:hypothetical protein